MTTLSLKDRLHLLVALPPSRLCQMLCVLSQQEEQDRIWALLVWIETERRGAKPLSQRATTRLRKALFPGKSMQRLMDGEAWYDPTIFELITESVLAPVLGAREQSPDSDELLDVLAGWSRGDNHPFFAVRSFVEELSSASLEALLPTVPQERKRRRQPHKKSAELLHVLMFLYHRDYVSLTEMVNLFGDHLKPQSSVWKRVARGLKAYYTELKKQTLSQKD